MARPRNLIPTYRKHSSGQAAVSVYRADGSRTEILLPGKYGSKKSKEEYERLLCQLRANEGQLPADAAKRDITIAELVLKFMAHATTYYVDPVTKTPIRKYLDTKLEAYLFRPSAQHEAMSAAKRATRKTKVQPSQQNRQKPNGQRRPGGRFAVQAVNRAIRRACEREGIERWHVHQLRHSASLTFCREMGLESARAALGHSSVNMSAMYAGRDIEAAKEVAKRVG